LLKLKTVADFLRVKNTAPLTVFLSPAHRCTSIDKHDLAGLLDDDRISASHLATNAPRECIDIERLLIWTAGIDGGRMQQNRNLVEPLAMQCRLEQWQKTSSRACGEACP
jgi:hypothetical protein